jgi:hypothetical protein
MVGLVFAMAASPIFLVSAAYGHEILGLALYFVAALALMVAYIRPTRFRRFMQRLLPTTAEKAERSRNEPK